MSQQGERPSAADDWWNRLYDESVPDTGPATVTSDTVDDRFDSAADAVGPTGKEAPDIEASGEPSPQEPDTANADRRPRAWWEQPPPAAEGRDPAPGPEYAPPVPLPRAPAPWEPPGGYEYEPTDSYASPVAGPRPPAQPAPPPPPPAPPVDRIGAPSDALPAPADEAAMPAVPRHAVPHDAVPGPTGPDATLRMLRPGGPTAVDGPSGVRTGEPPDPGGAPGGAPTAGGARDDVPATPPTTLPETPLRPASGSRDPRRRVTHVGDGPPTYDPEPSALPAAHADTLEHLVADTVLDGARYGTYTLRAVSARGDSARYRGEPRREALLTARFGTGPGALVLVAVASGTRVVEGAQRAAPDVCHWIAGAVGRSHGRLSDDIREGRRGDLKSGLHRLTDRSFGKLRARAAELGLEPEEYTAGLRCLLLSADPACRTRVFFGVGGGGLFRLRDGAWQDLEPVGPGPGDLTGAPVVGFGSEPTETPEGDRLTMDLGITTHPAPYVEDPVPPPARPFLFRASVARRGDTLLLCGSGLAEPLRDEPDFAAELAARWGPGEAPGLAEYLADTQLRVKGYAEDRTAVGVWEA